MNFTEILSYVMENPSTILTPVTEVATALISAIFFKKKASAETSTSEFEKIKAGHLKEAADELLNSGKMTYIEYYKMTNFLDIAKMADELNQEKQSKDPEEKYSVDWFMRFYDMTGTVSDEDMQNLWAKILAGEVARPGSFSLRTLEALRNLSKEEAVLFQKVCLHSIENNNRIYFPRYDAFMQEVGVTLDNLLKMEECGLVNSSGILALQLSLGTKWRPICGNKEVVLLAKIKTGEKKEVLKVAHYPYTSIGIELSCLVNREMPSDDIFVFANALIKNNKNSFDFSVNRVIHTDGVSYEFDNKNLL